MDNSSNSVLAAAHVRNCIIGLKKKKCCSDGSVYQSSADGMEGRGRTNSNRQSLEHSLSYF